MIIHFFTFSDRIAPSSRQRAFLIADELNARGMSAVVHTPTVLSLSKTRWPKKLSLIFELIRALGTIRKGDIIYLQRAIANKYFFCIMVLYLMFTRRKMIFDFDDPVYVHTPFKTKFFSKMADLVIVATERQRQWAEKHTSSVRLIHFGIDSTPYKKFQKTYPTNPAAPVIGWLGTAPEHLKNFPVLAGALRRLREAKVPFSFVLIGAFKDERVYKMFENLDAQFVDSLDYTDKEAAPREVQKFDIGVVPHAAEGEWNKGKTSMKVLEYMACRVPAVVSDFGYMPYVIKDGVDGFLASSEDAWVEKLALLLRDPHLRERLGRAGQDSVEAEHSFRVIVPQTIAAIQSVV